MNNIKLLELAQKYPKSYSIDKKPACVQVIRTTKKWYKTNKPGFQWEYEKCNTRK